MSAKNRFCIGEVVTVNFIHTLLCNIKVTIYYNKNCFIMILNLQSIIGVSYIKVVSPHAHESSCKKASTPHILKKSNYGSLSFIGLRADH